MIGIIGGNGVAATNRLLHLIENEVVNGGGGTETLTTQK